MDGWDDGRYRYRYHLTRDTGVGEGRVAFIMLNPSSADHDETDDTVDRCIEFARDWGFRTLEVGNLYAWYATDPHDLRHPQQDPVGPHNDHYLRCIATRCDRVVPAWGGQGEQHLGSQAFNSRANAVLRLLREAMSENQCLHHLVTKWTAEGYPLHPGRRSYRGTVSEEWEEENPPHQV